MQDGERDQAAHAVRDDRDRSAASLDFEEAREGIRGLEVVAAPVVSERAERARARGGGVEPGAVDVFFEESGQDADPPQRLDGSQNLGVDVKREIGCPEPERLSGRYPALSAVARDQARAFDAGDEDE